MAIISLGAINKRILFAVFGGGFKIIVNIILYHSEIKMQNHPCILGINAGLGLCLSIFPLLYLKFRNRKINSSNSSLSITEDLIYNDSISLMKDRKNKRRHYYMLSIAILDFLQKFLTFFYVKYFLENFWIFDSFLILLFSFLILKTKVYKHHFYSLIMIIIIGIILNVINYHDSEVTILHVVITLLTEIFYCLENVICKLAMDVKFSSPYEVCFLVGLFELIIFTLLLILFTNVSITGSENMNYLNEEYIDNFYIYIDKINLHEVLVFFLSMFGRCIFILFGYVLVDYFTPLHIVLILIIGEISFLFNDEYNWKLYLKIVFFVFLIFFILIFLEIIELNLCGLQQNTKKNISDRSEKEETEVGSLNSDNIEESKSRNPSDMDMQKLPLINENE